MVFSLSHNLHSYEYYIDLDLGIEYQMLWHSCWWHPTRLWAEYVRSHGLIPGGGQRFIFTPKCWGQLWGPSVLFIRCQELFSPGLKGQVGSWLLTTIPQCAITPCTGTPLLSLTWLISLLLVSWDESVMLKNKKGMFPASYLFWHSCGHPQGEVLQRMNITRYYKKFMNQCTDIKY